LSLLSTLAFWGCSQDIAGKGGTELPDPIQIYYVGTGSGSGSSTASGLYWRAWEQVDTTLEVGASARDSAGVLPLPNQNGTWVLEGWKDSLPSRVPVSAPLRQSIPDSCLDSVGSSVTIDATHNCADVLSPSRSMGITRSPAHVSAIRVSAGLPALRLRLTTSDGTAQVVPASARAWILVSGGDSLDFAGTLAVQSDGTMLMPRPSTTGWYLLEAWTGSPQLSDFVVGRQPFPSGRYLRYMNCMEMPGVPTTDVAVTVHTCPGMDADPSMTGADSSTAPDQWAAFELAP
jgi:hypothetical protein